jgi:glycosyltransferase involved in cell wall biosynthesis
MISIVVPVFNEEESLESFYRTLRETVHTISEKIEIIFIDDGSTDSTLQLMKEFAKKDTSVHIYSFRKNMGKAEALTCGFQKAIGEIIVTLDADLQDRPEEIARLVRRLREEKLDLLCGWRKSRKDSWYKLISSKLFNHIAKAIWGLSLHDYNCGLKVYASKSAKSLRLYGGLHRFIPLLAYNDGFTVAEEPVRHEKRQHGHSKYGFSKIWKDLPDIFTILFLVRYSRRPLHFFGPVGMVMATIGIFILLYLSFLHFSGVAIGNRPLLLFGVLFLLSGLQIFFTGFLAELITSVSQRNKADAPLRYSSEEAI